MFSSIMATKTFFIFLFFAFAAYGQQLIDTRDNKKYKTVKIGTQTWMAENLNYNADGSKCYKNEPANCDKYGRLYDWNTAKASCPKDWHLPSNAEWDSLYHFVDGSNGTSSPYKSKTAGKYLKATSGWDKNGNGEDKFGFVALPGGYGLSYGNFKNAGSYGNWWSASEYTDSLAYYRLMDSHYDDATWNDYYKRSYFSVRCLRD